MRLSATERAMRILGVYLAAAFLAFLIFLWTMGPIIVARGLELWSGLRSRGGL